ncbi:helix-turn-helix transcriptional regulator [Olivibacter sp. SDN3]|uniref:winged helix-turn-helix transcriptional regulator n=1 Tax=Olivibacter sp. SDN3 TaxID=2764720 RepID=UPI001650E249|nr:helix-turn-helix domain-containing protein [Olivibacter sp. SDN3]QNL51015.1 helix-turn-helix transcriptional regulator [Olivibacter sp. SDN3]
MYSYENKIPQDLTYGVTAAMKVIGGKWKPCIIDCINKGIKRPSQIHKAIGQASLRVIKQQLKELHDYDVVSKTMYQEYPLKVEYELTVFGKTVLPIIEVLQSWGDRHSEKIAELALRRQENIIYDK